MNILVLVSSSFPYGDAISSRMVSFCKLFSITGNQVHVIAMRSKGGKKTNINYTLDFCDYQIATSEKGSIKDSFFGNSKYVSMIKEYLENNHVDAVFSCGTEPYYKNLEKICHKNHIPLYLEQCEWMDVSSYRFGKYDYRYIRRNQLILKGYKTVDGVVAITRLLKDHFDKMGVPVVRIPTILDVNNINPALATNNKRITLIYTVNPSKSKEYMAPVINVLAEDEELRRKFEFHIYGPSRERVIENIGGSTKALDQAGDSVVIHGRVPQEEMEKIQREADFMLFIRPHRQSSDAGFPTKLGESMSVGTPVISNDTGDISLYLHNGVNGFLMRDGNEVEVRMTLMKILSLSNNEHKEMRRNARKTAEESFDYHCYQREIRTLFNMVEKTGGE